jgi:hypothetical protein
VVAVLLVDEGWVQTIYVARALERAGFRVTVCTANGGTAAYRRRSVDWQSAPTVASGELVPYLERIATGFERILPLTEAVMAALWSASPPWSDRIFPATTDEQRALLADKYVLLEHMAARGVAIPRQHRIDQGRDVDEPSQPRLTSALDLDAMVRELGLPLVVKGATGSAGERVWIAETRAELDDACARARSERGPWSIQEYIPGPTFLVGGLFVDGRPLRLYAAEKLAQHPPRTGPAIHVRSVHDADLLASALHVFRELRWTGIASSDFIRRPDGPFALLEVNPRPWGSIASAASAGVELFAPLAELLGGGTPRASLEFTAGNDCLIFPRYLLAPAYRSSRGLIQLVRDLRGEQGAEWRRPGFALHLAQRLYRMQLLRRA